MRTVLDLFSGIGGFALAVRRSGYGRVVGYCELDPFCRAVLAARIAEGRLDDAPIQNDVRELDPLTFRGVDLITGGFPCQDVSAAGKGAGIGGERSGLWFEMARIIAGILPPRLLIENVPALRTRGADRVLADLEALGYDAWPLVVGAWAVGAPHRRERVWIVGRRCGSRPIGRGRDPSSELADADRGRREGERLAHRQPEHEGAPRRIADRRDGSRLADPDGPGLRERGGSRGDGHDTRREPLARYGSWPARPGEQQHGWEEPRLVLYNMADAEVGGRGELRRGREATRDAPVEREDALEQGQGSTELPMGRATTGVPLRLVRAARRNNREALRAFGNAIVPQVAEMILRTMDETEE